MRKVSWHISLGLHGPAELGFSLVQLAFFAPDIRRYHYRAVSNGFFDLALEAIHPAQVGIGFSRRVELSRLPNSFQWRPQRRPPRDIRCLPEEIGALLSLWRTWHQLKGIIQPS